MLITIDGLLAPDEVQSLCQALEAAQWQDGAATAGTLARRVKQNQQLADSDPLARQWGDFILQRLQAHPLFISAALPRRIHPPKFNRYADGGHYGTHVDGALMHPPGAAEGLRSDVSATLFLSDPDEYAGGELLIETPFGAQAVKLLAGDLVLYPSTSLHRVAPVSAGVRIASFFWIESWVADEGARSLLFDLDQSIQALQAPALAASPASPASPALAADDERLLPLSGVYHNLLRRWAGR